MAAQKLNRDGRCAVCNSRGHRSDAASVVAETGARSSHDPYFLYAASNLGSLGALISYPTVIEPYLRVSDQSHFWTAAYVVLIVLCVACAAMVAARKSALRL